MAESRIGTIISRITKSRYTELYAVVFCTLTMLVFWGSPAEGQALLLERWARKHVEVASAGLNLPSRFSGIQLADINSFAAGFGGDAASSVSPTPSMAAGTVQESAFLAVSTPDGSYLEQLSEERSQVIEYTVQEGDLISFIASDFGVSVNSIIWANGLKDADSISLNQVLRIPPVTGVVHKVAKGDNVAALAKKYGVEADRIIAYNRLPQDGVLEVGDEVIVPDGKITSTAASSVARSGTASIASTIKKAVTAFAHLPDLGEFFFKPTNGRIRQLIHGRNGIDIANSYGTPVYAAADGTVTVSDAVGYNGGFGQHIKIQHANGTETLYAHGSKLLVAAGQTVARGQKIMLMGSTGRSTGNHLHFEVHGARNPLAKY